MTDRTPAVVYRVDRADTIEFVNDAWARFARANDAAQLAEGVLGASLWDYIAGDDVAQLYRDLLARVRMAAVCVEFPFRCDSQQRRRDMHLILAPLEDRKVEFRAVLKSERPHASPIHLLGPGPATTSDSFVTMCAWCKATKVDGEWVALEEAVQRTPYMLQHPFPSLSHGICDSCAKTYQALAFDAGTAQQ
jgi:hypothetical protein